MTTKSRLVSGGVLVVLVAVFLAGFWPERQRRLALETEAVSLRTRVQALDDRVRLAQLHGQLLDLIDAVAAMNYGQAQGLSSALFDNVRAEAARTGNSGYRSTLEAIMAVRDEVTTALAKGDALALEPLRQAERKLRSVSISADSARN